MCEVEGGNLKGDMCCIKLGNNVDVTLWVMTRSITFMSFALPLAGSSFANHMSFWKSVHPQNAGSCLTELEHHSYRMCIRAWWTSIMLMKHIHRLPSIKCHGWLRSKKVQPCGFPWFNVWSFCSLFNQTEGSRRISRIPSIRSSVNCH